MLKIEDYERTILQTLRANDYMLTKLLLCLKNLKASSQ